MYYYEVKKVYITCIWETIWRYSKITTEFMSFPYSEVNNIKDISSQISNL